MKESRESGGGIGTAGVEIVVRKPPYDCGFHHSVATEPYMPRNFLYADTIDVIKVQRWTGDEMCCCNYTDENGKQHGRKRSDRNAYTHYRIKHRDEM